MTRPHGHADGLVGAYVTGWAMSSSDDVAKFCLITIHAPDGVVLASGFANRTRPDLAVLGGRIDIGYRILLPDLGGITVLHVCADDVELPNSPIRVGRDCFDGDLVVKGDMATGWVRARVADPVSPHVTLHTEDGMVVGEAEAEYVIDESDPHTSRARFRIEIADAAFGIAEFLLVARADGHYFARASSQLPLEGYLDILDAGHCAGWLICLGAPHRQLRLEIIRDGVIAGRGRCTVPRDDLRDHYPVGWRNGFSIPLDPLEGDDRYIPHTISIRVAGGRTELLHGPHLLGDRFALVSVARKLNQIVHATALGRAEQPFSPAECGVLQDVLWRHIAERRHGPSHDVIRAFTTGDLNPNRAVDILIPIYKGIEITEVCIESALRVLRPSDRVILVADCPPEAGMLTMLDRYRSRHNVVLLNNTTNQGFIGAINRGLAYCRTNDVLLLNSDTCLFADGLDEMRRTLHGAADVATVTALSNNATIFSYPHPTLPTEKLADLEWSEVARIFAETGSGRYIEVPTGHGFCMLIRREVLNRLGGLNEAFGRGYGEENELCLRATDLGFRHLAALGAFVEHRESVSFGNDKEALLLANLPKLVQMYPEYTPLIMNFEATDPLRVGRWPVDIARLRAAKAAGTRFVLIVYNWLGGGTRRAVSDIGNAAGYAGRTELHLHNTRSGTIQLDSIDLHIRATFLDQDGAELVEVLDAAGIDLVVIHQFLGFGPGIVDAFSQWSSKRRSVAYIHDFYPICPRVTLIDAVNRFCGVASPDICDRCVAIGGGHEATKLGQLTASEHRILFARVLAGMTAVIAPSLDAADYVRRAFPTQAVKVVPHPERPVTLASRGIKRDPNVVALLGGIGPHKGAAKLVELARLAALSHPDLHFAVIGHTSLDEVLEVLPNVTITGKYEQSELPNLVMASCASIALFLHVWPETYSYTLSEAASAGLLPVVPDIGAPAERVRATGWGRVFPFQTSATDLLTLLTEIGQSLPPEAPPLDRFDTSGSIPLLKSLFGELPLPEDNVEGLGC